MRINKVLIAAVFFVLSSSALALGESARRIATPLLITVGVIILAIFILSKKPARGK